MSGPLESSITLEEVFAVVSAKRVPLAPELAGYLALEIAEGAGGAPGEVDPRQVYIGDEGTVALVRQKRNDAATDKAEESIRSLLQRLLEASGSQTPALDAAAKKEAGAGIASLAQELEAALVPVNRAAGRRALARLAREVKRVTLGVGRNASIPPDAQQRRSIRGSQPSYPGQAGRTTADGRKSRPRDEVDSLLSAFEVEGPRSDAVVSRDLKEIAGLTPTPPPIHPASLPMPVPVPAPASAKTPAGTFPASTREPVSSTRASASAPLSAPLSSRGQALTAPGQGPGQRQAAKRIGIIVAAVAVLAVGAVVLAWILRSGSRTPATFPVEKAALEPGPSARPPRPCKATVIITDAPPRAELLVRAGQTPLEVPRMPVGARLEFVATGEGFAPKRAVIPARAAWDAGSGKPRYEMTIELEKSRAKSGAIDPWPPGEPGSEVGGHGAPGTVHIVSTPRSAEIWLLAGLGPEATIDQLACDSDVDILVAGPFTYRKRLHIGQNEFVEVSPPGGEVARKARVSAK
ncbi:hypothetical protein LVJ94_15530 [Pendulispora rubella]|uniref:Uncharacterized protein n=1 Tax=Pendulispora rubella TaxID=2741070 RepID=A0ABZ2LCL1_9BACT